MASLGSLARIALGGMALLAATAIPAVRAQGSADYFVHSLPGAPDDGLKMHAGHIEITPEHNGNLFFWHFENKHIANRQRTVIWLNGGPGCSSEDGALMEIGPYRLKDDSTLEYNNGSWHEFANLLFVDNPVGTGFSYVDTNSYLKELDEMATQFVTFLEKWFALFPEYEHDDLYFAGESYAGQHIPYIAKAILARNKQPQTKHQWNLKGLLIGNGWISPRDQYGAYIPFAYERGLVQKGSDIAARLENQWQTCQGDLAAATEVDVSSCEAILQEMLKLTSTSQDGTTKCTNMYDISLTDTYPSCGMNWPPDLVHVTPYLRKPEVVSALHINPAKTTGWTECNGAVGSAFRARNSKPAIEFFPDLLSEVNILLFSGSNDLICNHLGTESLISNLEWAGGKGFEVTPGNWAPRRDWTFEGEAAGFWQSARNLTYVVFYNASHMVPFDYSRRSRDMLDRFIGVDISSIGGTPSESLLDGEKLPDTTVGGAANSTSSAAKDKELQAAKWAAYQRSGEIVLVIVIIAASAWGWFLWRSRRRTLGYQGLSTVADRIRPRGGHQGFRSKINGGDVEAGDFDESALDDLHVETPTETEPGHYSIGDDEDDDDFEKKPKNGQASGSR